MTRIQREIVRSIDHHTRQIRLLKRSMEAQRKLDRWAARVQRARRPKPKKG